MVVVMVKDLRSLQDILTQIQDHRKAGTEYRRTPEQGRCENVWLVVFWLCVVPLCLDDGVKRDVKRYTAVMPL
jgi:hypothetical protein